MYLFHRDTAQNYSKTNCPLINIPAMILTMNLHSFKMIYSNAYMLEKNI